MHWSRTLYTAEVESSLLNSQREVFTLQNASRALSIYWASFALLCCDNMNLAIRAFTQRQ